MIVSEGRQWRPQKQHTAVHNKTISGRAAVTRGSDAADACMSSRNLAQTSLHENSLSAGRKYQLGKCSNRCECRKTCWEGGGGGGEGATLTNWPIRPHPFSSVITNTVAWHVITPAVLWRRVILCTVQRPNATIIPSTPLPPCLSPSLSTRPYTQSQIPVIVWGTRWEHNYFGGGRLYDSPQWPAPKSKYQTTSHWNWMHLLVSLYGTGKKVDISN